MITIIYPPGSTTVHYISNPAAAALAAAFAELPTAQRLRTLQALVSRELENLYPNPDRRLAVLESIQRDPLLNDVDVDDETRCRWFACWLHIGGFRD